MTATSGGARLSIVIATLNSERTLERCIQSIAGQTFRSWELIIVDGGSSDGTVDIVRRHEASIAYWHSRPDQGIYDAWNQALDHATGEYVAFLGADDVWHEPGTLQSVFDRVDGHAYDLVTGCGQLVDARGKKLYRFGLPWNYSKVMRRMTICHPGALHSRGLFDQYGLFDTTYRISADYDFLLRLPSTVQSLHLEQTLVDVEDAGISRDRRWQMLMERYRAQRDCPRVGALRAAFNLVDKLWRIPVAKALGIPV